MGHSPTALYLSIAHTHIICDMSFTVSAAQTNGFCRRELEHGITLLVALTTAVQQGTACAFISLIKVIHALQGLPCDDATNSKLVEDAQTLYCSKENQFPTDIKCSSGYIDVQEALEFFPCLRRVAATAVSLFPDGVSSASGAFCTMLGGDDAIFLPGGIAAAVQGVAQAAMAAAAGMLSAITVTYGGHVTPLFIRSAPSAVADSLQVLELIWGNDVGHQLVQPGSLDAPKGGYYICVKAADTPDPRGPPQSRRLCTRSRMERQGQRAWR